MDSVQPRSTGRHRQQDRLLAGGICRPYHTFLNADADITVASPNGGQPPLDPKSDLPDFQTELAKYVKADPATQAVLANTVKLETVAQEDFDTVFYPGDSGPLWDMAESATSIALIESFERAGSLPNQV